jgi:hypothetical protein
MAELSVCVKPVRLRGPARVWDLKCGMLDQLGASLQFWGLGPQTAASRAVSCADPARGTPSKVV